MLLDIVIVQKLERFLDNTTLLSTRLYASSQSIDQTYIPTIT